jgi:UDP-hydrolysing UDP-N-acetyl-D-glucosamine 2-epimerase
VTLEYEETDWQVRELLDALRACALPVVFTMPNADTNGRIIRKLMEDFVSRTSSAQMVANLGLEGYSSLMRQAVAMVGNSSSGIIEAPLFGLPVVNIGTRQQGRLRAENIVDVGYHREEILEGIRKAVVPEFRARLTGKPNPYGNGCASEVIVKRLQEVPLDRKLIQKRFVDVPLPSMC